ncbi:MAG: two-component system response regulator [Methylocystaceae bacterium]|nr:MAG: two-component system response regulator [Methylocystaceae bacterium]
MRILIVEDQYEMAKLIADRIGDAGYVSDHVGDIPNALEALRAHDYPLMLLDRRLPDGDAIEALSTIRRIRPEIRILLVTALHSTSDKIDGLDAGADDYLAKPFDADELLARIRASLRRPGGRPLPLVIVGDLSFDLNSREAFVAGEPLLLHKREMLLLETLVRRTGRAVTHDTLIEEIYGLSGTVQFDALKMLVSRVRQRLKESRAGAEIYTARGIGYLIRTARA